MSSRTWGKKVREPFETASTADKKASDVESSSKTDEMDADSTVGETTETEDPGYPPIPDEIKKDRTAAEREKAPDSDASPESENIPPDSSSPGTSTPQEGQSEDA